jgi:hypothetical protein
MKKPSPWIATSVFLSVFWTDPWLKMWLTFWMEVPRPICIGFLPQAALGRRGDLAGLAQQVREVGPGVFEARRVDVGDVVAFHVHRDLVGLEAGYAGPE